MQQIIRRDNPQMNFLYLLALSTQGYSRAPIKAPIQSGAYILLQNPTVVGEWGKRSIGNHTALHYCSPCIDLTRGTYQVTHWTTWSMMAPLCVACRRTPGPVLSSFVLCCLIFYLTQCASSILIYDRLTLLSLQTSTNDLIYQARNIFTALEFVWVIFNVFLGVGIRSRLKI